MTLSTCVKSFIGSVRTPRALVRGAAIAGALLVGVAAMPATSVAQAHGSYFYYHRGYTVQHGYLCYGYANRAIHCTKRWHRTRGGALVSNSSWVPNGASASTVKTAAAVQAAPTQAAPAVSAAPAGISQWANPGRGSWAMSGASANGYPFGTCTWYPAYKDHNYAFLGNAYNWTNAARARGMATGSGPAVGAAAVFQPHVQGAGGGGHVAYVEQVYGNGWFLVSEMNFTWNGGGWGRVSFRYAHTGPGVSFIYG